MPPGIEGGGKWINERGLKVTIEARRIVSA